MCAGNIKLLRAIRYTLYIQPFPQIYIGSSRRTVLQNQDILQGLEVGMMVASKDVDFVRVGRVTNIPADRTLQSVVQVLWYHQEKATQKPQWL